MAAAGNGQANTEFDGAVWEASQDGKPILIDTPERVSHDSYYQQRDPSHGHSNHSTGHHGPSHRLDHRAGHRSGYHSGHHPDCRPGYCHRHCPQPFPKHLPGSGQSGPSENANSTHPDPDHRQDPYQPWLSENASSVLPGPDHRRGHRPQYTVENHAVHVGQDYHSDGFQPEPPRNTDGMPPSPYYHPDHYDPRPLAKANNIYPLQPTSRGPVPIASLDPEPDPRSDSKPNPPSRKSGGHWFWDPSYMDYVQKRGDQLVLYSDYQNRGPVPQSRSTTAGEHYSRSGHDLLDRSYDTRSLDDLAVNSGVKDTRPFNLSPQQGDGPKQMFGQLNLPYRTAAPQMRPTPTAGLTPATNLYEQALDPEFRIVEKPKRFFSVGRIFKVVWFEPLGERAPTMSSELNWSATCPSFHEEKPYARFRWFIVVRKRLHHSLCLSITTVGSRGPAKTSRGRAKDFVVLYPHTVDPPEPFPEEGIARRPLAVIIEEGEQLLAPAARLDCARIYTVEDNVKVMKIGRVHPDSLDDLEEYYKESVS